MVIGEVLRGGTHWPSPHQQHILLREKRFQGMRGQGNNWHPQVCCGQCQAMWVPISTTSIQEALLERPSQSSRNCPSCFPPVCPLALIRLKLLQPRFAEHMLRGRNDPQACCGARNEANCTAHGKRALREPPAGHRTLDPTLHLCSSSPARLCCSSRSRCRPGWRTRAGRLARRSPPRQP